jgi:predicted RNA-binding protein
MSRCHVFVVNKQTFPYHLKYLFAGTTPGKNSSEKSRASKVSLLADIARTREGDKVVFYLEEIGFFGVFEVASEVFEDCEGYLQNELGVPLIYRVRIKPAEVYAKPVSEWEAIDKLPEKSRDILWSLLYRKLKAKRGCSYLFPNESERLIELIRKQNEGQPITARENECYTYDHQNRTITLEQGKYSYTGSSNKKPASQIDLDKAEVDLQAWVCWNLGREQTLDQIVPSKALQWFANEVYAGSGTQKMDILAILTVNGTREFRVLELKNKQVKVSDAQTLKDQTQRYVWWLDSYQRNFEDTIRVFWVARGFESGVEKFAAELEQMEKDKGLTKVELWKWGSSRGTITLTPYSSDSNTLFTLDTE